MPRSTSQSLAVPDFFRVFFPVLRTVCLNFCGLLLQNTSTRLIAKAKLTGNVILSKVVCFSIMYGNAFVKMCVFHIVPVVPGVLQQYFSCLVCLRLD